MDAAASAASPAAPMSEVEGSNGPAPSGKTRSAKASAASGKTGRKRSSAAQRKTTPGDKPRKTLAKKKPAPAQSAVSDDDIRLRAYFLAEERARKGVAGDSAHDWMEARRQLLAEAAGRA